jgi:hypothetical protein
MEKNEILNELQSSALEELNKAYDEEAEILGLPPEEVTIKLQEAQARTLEAYEKCKLLGIPVDNTGYMAAVREKRRTDK